MHPELAKLRQPNRGANALERARQILDTHRGPLTLDPPTVATVDERDDLELAARAQARRILTSHEIREALAHLEHNQRTTAAEALGLTADTTNPPTVEHDEATAALVDELLDELHRAATLVPLIQHAAITHAP